MDSEIQCRVFFRRDIFIRFCFSFFIFFRHPIRILSYYTNNMSTNREEKDEYLDKPHRLAGNKTDKQKRKSVRNKRQQTSI